LKKYQKDTSPEKYQDIFKKAKAKYYGSRKKNEEKAEEFKEKGNAFVAEKKI